MIRDAGPVSIERLKRNLDVVRASMAAAAAKSSRAPDSVTLVAITKYVGTAEIAGLRSLGVTDFGESRIQDAERKLAALRADPRFFPSPLWGEGRERGMVSLPPPAWHLVGHLQTNKADKAAKLFQWVHSVDSLRVAQALNKERAKLTPPSPAPLNCLLEVNTASEASKFGLRPDASEIAEVLKACAVLSAVRIAGLMTMAPYTENPEPVCRPIFKRLRELHETVNAKNIYPHPLTALSMGMTQDYTIAIEEGATLVRVGSALFA